jgi:glucosamine--fructose-6-phosphate aminotransferase (isomerizing)
MVQLLLIDESMPVVVLPGGHYDKIVSNIQEIKSRSGRIIAVGQRRYRR